MNLQKIKEAIAFERQHNCEYANVLCDLAETVLAVGAKMPEKKEFYKSPEHYSEDSNCDANYVGGYNEAIDACTLAFASMLDREKLYAILGKSVEFDEDGNAWTNHTKVVDAILSAMKGGVK